MPTVEHLIERFQVLFGRAPEIYGRAPGKVNLLGDYADCNGGLAVAVALNRGIRLLAAKREDSRLVAYATTFSEFHAARMDTHLVPSGHREWHDYLRAVIHQMKLRGVQVPGLDLLVSCDLPLGAGLAAAPAATVATARLLQQVAGSPMKPQELALLAQAAEQGAFIGERSSIINHLAICCSEADMATLIDCQSLEVSQLPVPFGEAVVVVVNTGLGSARAQATNMERQRECDAGLEALRAADNEPYATLRQVPVDAIERHGGALPEAVRKRMRHAVAENLRVAAFADALRAGDLAAGGALMHESHQSLRENYEVSCPELDFIVECRCRIRGCLRLPECRNTVRRMRGGTGKTDGRRLVCGHLIRAFNERFGHKPEIYASHPTRGAVARLSGSPSESGFHQRVDMPTEVRSGGCAQVPAPRPD